MCVSCPPVKDDTSRALAFSYSDVSEVPSTQGHSFYIPQNANWHLRPIFAWEFVLRK